MSDSAAPEGARGGGNPSTLPTPPTTTNSAAAAAAVTSAKAPSLTPADVHVLLVDDERMQRMVVASLLRKCSYKVTDVESGLQAIEKLRSNPPGTFDLVLTDVMMPDVDGVELLRHVRSDDSLRAVPVVMMSANEHAETVFECIRLGAEDYLLKPVGRKEVQHIWQHVWRRQRAVREGGGGGRATATEEQLDASAAAADAAAAPVAAAHAEAPATSEAVLVEVEEGEARTATAEGTAATASAASPSAAAAPSPTTTTTEPLLPLPSPPSAAAAAAARTFPRAAPNALTLAEYLRRRGPRPAPLAAFKLFCSALALLRPLHSAGGCLLRLRPSSLVLGAGGALSPCSPSTPDGRVPPEEEAGYAAPEQLLLGGESSGANASSSVVVGAPADVYALGVLFLELFCPLPDEDADANGTAAAGTATATATAAPTAATLAARATRRAAVLAALRHRILPSSVLASRPREAAFVTALVHPDAASRPTIDAILTSGWLPALRDAAREEAAALSSSAGGGGGARPAAAAATTAPRPRPTAAPAASTAPASPDSTTAAARAKETTTRASPSAVAAAKTSAAGEACARPRPPPTAIPDAALLIEFLGMVRDARAAEAEAEARALAALDADAAEVERRLAELDGQRASALLGGGGNGGGKAGAEGEEEVGEPAVDAEAAAAVPGSGSYNSSSDSEGARTKAAGAAAGETAAAAAGGAEHAPPAATTTTEKKRKRSRSEQEDDDETGVDIGGSRQRQQLQLNPSAAAAADAAAAAAWARVSAAAPSLEAAFLSRFGGCERGPPQQQLLLEGGENRNGHRRALLPAPPASATDQRQGQLEEGTTSLVSKQRSDRLAAFAADLGRFSRIGRLVEVARIESATGGVGGVGSAPSRGGAVFSSAANDAAASMSSSSSSLAAGAVSPDMVCSCAFDRDDEFLATAGVARRVRIYSVSSLLAEGGVVGSGSANSSSNLLRPRCSPPVAEVRASSKLSCVTWNPYVRPLLLVSGYDGRVTLWDSAAERAAASFDGTERRVWACDWSGSDAALFAAGGDDGVARLWDAGRCSSPAASVDVRANVCSVAFSGAGVAGGRGDGGAGGALRPHLLALGAADRRAYVYDVRNLAEPLAVLGGQRVEVRRRNGIGGVVGASSSSPGYEVVGHKRAVSYVRWAPDGQLVSASTDSRLQRWDVELAASAASAGSPSPEAILPTSPIVATYRGHVNERNFVGLSISPASEKGDGGLVATGSEDDAVYLYCGALPQPVSRHSFVGGSGEEDEGGNDDNAPALLSSAAPGSSSSALSMPGRQQQPQPYPTRRSNRASGRFFVSSLAWAGKGKRLVAADSAGIVKLLELR